MNESKISLKSNNLNILEINSEIIKEGSFANKKIEEKEENS
jgi:hypothetical protein